MLKITTQTNEIKNRARKVLVRSAFPSLLLILLGLASYASLSLFSAPTTSAVTTVPTKLNFQGRLTDSAGTVKPSGTYNMRFKLFTVASGGTNVWAEDRLVSASQGVTVTNGQFSVQLGSVTALPASLFASGALYLEVELPTPATATTSSPSWTEGAMTPRNQMATSAYAYNAETLDGLDSSDFATVTGGAGYIQNQTASPQVAGFNINGSGTIGANLNVAGTSLFTGTVTVGNSTNLTSLPGGLIVKDTTSSSTGATVTLTTGGNTTSSILGINFIDRINATSQGAEGQIGAFIRVKRETTSANFDLVFGTNNGNLAADAVDQVIIENSGHLNVLTGDMQLGGTTVLTSGRALQNVVSVTSSGVVSGTQLASTVATGTAPLTVISTTKVTNLNVDLLDGLDSTAFAAASGSGSYIQNTTSPQTASMNITGSATVGSMTVNGNFVVASSTTTGINGTAAYVSLHTGRAWDGAYEYLGFNSGSTRQGIILYDGTWGGCRNVSYELCLKAENDNDLTLVSEWDVYLWAKGGAGDIHLNAGSGQILAVNNGTNVNPAYSFTSNQGMGMYVTSASELALGTNSTARLVLSGNSAELWMGTTQRGERMCHNRGNSPTAGLAIIGDCSAGGSDFAEYYGSPGDVPVATIVEYDEAKPIEYLVDPTDPSRMGNKAFVKTATNRSKSLGVYSTNPFVDILGKEYYSDADNIIPIGLAGRVPVRVNTSNGPIRVGDPVALSTTPGVGAKAIDAGQIIGYSMQDFSGEGEGTVVVLVSTGYWAPTDLNSLQGQSATYNDLQVNGTATLAALNVTGASTLSELVVTGNTTLRGTLTVEEDVRILGNLTVKDAEFTGTITVNGRIIARGSSPEVQNGQALGVSDTNAATASTVAITGNDTTGSLKIVTGGVGVKPGVLATVTFAEGYAGKAFNVVLSATNSNAGNLRVHVVKTSNGFEIVANDQPQAGTEYQFDYIVIGAE